MTGFSFNAQITCFIDFLKDHFKNFEMFPFIFYFILFIYLFIYLYFLIDLWVQMFCLVSILYHSKLYIYASSC